MKVRRAAAICFASTLCIGTAVRAAPCTTIADDARRLSCFDERTACVEISDDAARLTCYERGIQTLAVEPQPEAAPLPPAGEPPAIAPEVAPMAARTAAAPVPRTAQARPARPTPAPDTQAESQTDPQPASSVVEQTEAESADELFPVRGASDRTATEPEPVTMTAVIVSAKRDARKLTIITLDNDQVWREIQKSRFNYQPGMRVEISEGVLGSVNLSAPGMSKYVKVKRLQ